MLLRRGVLLILNVIYQISRLHRAKKSPILTRIVYFRTVTPSWIQWRLRNKAQSLTQCRRGSLLFSGFIHQISRAHAGFDLHLVFPNCNSSLSLLVALNWCTKLDVTLKSCPIVFEVIHHISRSQRKKHHRFWPKRASPACNSSFNSPMALKWCKKPDILWKGCSVVFRGHSSYFKVTWDEKSMISTQFE